MRTIRKNQVISPFGLGAIYDFKGESFVHSKTSQWDKGNKINLPRLERNLRVDHFRTPPFAGGRFAANDFQKVHFKRFPAWHFCPNSECRDMIRLKPSDEVRDETPRCPHCRKKLVPMRFVSICEHGHLDEVNWWWWVHNENQGVNCQTRHRMKFISRPNRGTGLGALFIYCSGCKSEKSLQDIVRKDQMRAIGLSCKGRHPWHWQGEECSAVPQVVQRGASNVYFPRVVSALDIPSVQLDGDSANSIALIKNNGNFDILKNMVDSLESEDAVLDNPAFKFFIDRICADENCAPEMVVMALEDSGDEVESAEIELDTGQILKEEWAVLTEQFPNTTNFKKIDIITSTAEGQGGVELRDYSGLIDRLSLITKIREVRALSGFERFKTTGDHTVSTKLQNKFWMPALEVYGEGVFFSLKEDQLSAWEQKHAQFLAPRISAATESWANNSLESFLPEPNARFILLHTLAHLLMRQIVFECGYSSTSLRERIYSSEEGDQAMAGILIYTADSDSEGALGGLVDQGREETFMNNVINALAGAEWCSNDPICSEIEGQGLAGLNRAACHACALVAETSCVYGNALLDRTLLLGTRDETSDFKGYFEDFLNQIRTK